MKTKLEMKKHQVAQVVPESEISQLHKPIYLAPSIEEYSYLVEAGYASSVMPDPEGLGNGYYGGGSGSKSDAPLIEGAYQPYSDPTEDLNYIDF